MKQVEKSRKIPIKNYVLVGILFIGIILLLCYFSRWYQVYSDYEKQTPVIRGTLSEITNLELDHYILENPTTAIYMCTSSDMKCRNFEKALKSMLDKNETLKENLLYLNLSDINQEEFVHSFNEKYSYKVKLTKDYPAVVLFEEGKIIGLLQEKSNENLDVNDVRSFLKLHMVGDEE